MFTVQIFSHTLRYVAVNHAGSIFKYIQDLITFLHPSNSLLSGPCCTRPLQPILHTAARGSQLKRIMPLARNLQGLPAHSEDKPKTQQCPVWTYNRPPVFLPSHHLFVGFGTCQACSHFLCAWNILPPDSVIVVRPSPWRPCSNVTFSGKHSLITFSEPHLPSPNIPLSPSWLYFQSWHLYFPKHFITDYFVYGLSVLSLDPLS